MKTFQILGLVLIFCLSMSSAFGMGGAPTPTAQGTPNLPNYKFLTENHEDLAYGVKQLGQKWDADEETFKTNSTKLDAAIQHAFKSEGDARAKLAEVERKKQDLIRKQSKKIVIDKAATDSAATDEEGALKTALEEETEAKLKLEKAADLRKLVDESTKIKAESAALSAVAKGALAEIDKQIDGLKGMYGEKATAAETKLKAESARVQELIKSGDEKAKKEGLLSLKKLADDEFLLLRKNRMTEQKIQLLDKLYDRVKDDYNEAKFIFADVDNLQNKARNDLEILGHLQARTNIRIDRTPMGNYVKQQIAKAMANMCDIQKSCSSGSQGENEAIRKNVESLLRVVDLTKDKDGKDVVPMKPIGTPAN